MYLVITSNMLLLIDFVQRREFSTVMHYHITHFDFTFTLGWFYCILNSVFARTKVDSLHVHTTNFISLFLITMFKSALKTLENQLCKKKFGKKCSLYDSIDLPNDE